MKLTADFVTNQAADSRAAEGTEGAAAGQNGAADRTRTNPRNLKDLLR